MAVPQIVNRRPAQGDTGVDALTPFRFGARDADTRADLSSIYSTVVYGDGVYDPANEELPTNDDVLAAAGVSATFSTFNDAAGTAAPGNPCDQTLEEVVGIDVYRVEHDDVDGEAQEGVLFLTVPEQPTHRPYAFKAQLDLAFVAADSFSYVTFSGFTGVLMGLVYWPENTGIFLFFVDDGTKKIVIAGPAEDGVGTRSVSTSVVFDWSAEAYTYSIAWDPTVYRRQAQVYATDSLGVETLLVEVDIDTLPEFLASVRMGSLYAEDSPSGVTMVLGGDFPDQGNYIDIYSFSILDFGRVMVVDGTPTGSSVLDIHPTESVFVDGPEGADEWLTNGTATETQTATSTKLVSDSGVGEDYKYRSEPDLSAGEWLVMGRMAGENSLHPGEYTTAMGLSVSDGTRAFRLTMLDDFSRNFLGIEESDSVDDDTVTGFKVPASDTDWEDGFSFTLLGSLSRNILRLFVDSDTEIAVGHTYTAAGYPASSDTEVQWGFFDSGTAVTGEFYLLHLWVLPNCVHYEPEAATYPESQGWTRVSSGGTRALTSDELDVDCSTTGQYDIYYLLDTTYDSTSGGCIVFRLAVDAWTDSSGSVNPIKTEFGPVAAVRTSTVAAQVFFVENDDGRAYVYLSQELSDVTDVLAQNEAGRAISSEINLDTAHVYFLDVKPYQYIRLYVDHSPAPVIEVLWASFSEGLRALPTNMPSTAVVAAGSLGEDSGIEGTFSFFRASIGKGYDLSVTLDVSEADLQASVYGSVADILIDLQDED